VETHLKN